MSNFKGKKGSASGYRLESLSLLILFHLFPKRLQSHHISHFMKFIIRFEVNIFSISISFFSILPRRLLLIPRIFHVRTLWPNKKEEKNILRIHSNWYTANSKSKNEIELEHMLNLLKKNTNKMNGVKCSWYERNFSMACEIANVAFYAHEIISY